MIEIVKVETEKQLNAVRVLFLEYAAALGHDLGFQDFEKELAGLPGRYAPPEGGLLLADSDGEPAGCAGLRRLEPGVCEMKRMYVRADFRSLRLGRRLAEAVLEEARRLGYRRMRLDTLVEMRAANRLYESLGFKDIPAYYHNPLPGARFMELELG